MLFQMTICSALTGEGIDFTVCGVGMRSLCRVVLKVSYGNAQETGFIGNMSLLRRVCSLERSLGK